MKCSLLTVVIFLVSGLAGCNNTQVINSDLVGEWRLTESSRLRLPASMQKASAKMTINEDGSFAVLEIPRTLLYFSTDDHHSFVTGSGRWKLGSQGEAQQLKLEFLTIEGAKKGETPFETNMFVSGEGANIFLFYFQGDPDEGIRIKFEKLTTKK